MAGDVSLNPIKIPQKRGPRAIALISGGLDSALATKLVKSWGIEVIGLHLVSPFGCLLDANRVARELEIPLITREKGEAFVDLVKDPKYGYGSQMNPCIDCRIYMFEMAEKVKIEQDADFIVTGEVVGQRPFSQNKAAISVIERKAKMDPIVLRPLSGANLPPTLAEEKGWIQRENLLKISGRGRSEQLELAKRLGVTEFASPGGGCLLTETAFSERLKDFYSFPTYRNSTQKMIQAQFLRLGRHFRLSGETKFIVARTDSENQEMNRLWETSGGSLFEPSNFVGPCGLALGKLTEGIKEQLASLLARYGKKNGSEPYRVSNRFLNEKQTVTTHFLDTLEPIPDETLNPWRIGIT